MTTRRLNGWCALCRSRCGCVSVVEDGRLVKVEPDPEHPTGRALCAKGQAGPELVYNEQRSLYPMKRTQPKGSPDPGWQRISWEEALDMVALKMRAAEAESGRESVAFAMTTGSGTSVSDNNFWLERLMRAFGATNNCYGTEICNWHKDVASQYTYGVGVGTPDIDQAGCVLLWGHNPNTAWLAQGQRVAKAKRHGLKVVVVDPRKAGPAVKADAWLRVRPGTDGLLALGMARIMLEHGYFDDEFVAQFTNAPYLVHPTEQRPLTVGDLAAPPQNAEAKAPLMWDSTRSAVVVVPQGARSYGIGPAVLGEFEVHTLHGNLRCKTVLSEYLALCRDSSLEEIAAKCGVSVEQMAHAASLLWDSRPVSYYAWSGVGQHANATQTDRAISILYSLLGCIDAPGGNVQLHTVPAGDVAGAGLIHPQAFAKTLGKEERPLGPPKNGWCTSRDLYRSIIDGDPYPTRVLINFGTNLLLSHAGVPQGIKALTTLDFQVHADLYVTPTAQYADIFLPINTPWEREAVRMGFEGDRLANGLVQYRAAAVASRGQSQDDGWIAFELAQRLGLGKHFWNGDRQAGMREWLAPAGIDLEDLKQAERGIQVDLPSPYGRLRESRFPTPSGRIEIWSETFRTHGYTPLPAYRAPTWAKMREAGAAQGFPFILTSAKSPQYCHGQHRNLPKLRRLSRNPRIELHPTTALGRALNDGDWAEVSTPAGRIEAQVKHNNHLEPGVAVGEHGWWQACDALDIAGFPVSGPGSANFNVLIDDADEDPISGSAPHRSYVCNITALRSQG
jgi:anaerobic selenocysteine-containing dehydrogenase